MQNETQQNNMSFDRKEGLINELLRYMKNEMENSGNTTKTHYFDFSLSYLEKYFSDHPDEIIPEGTSLTALKKIIDLSDNEFKIIFNSCQANEYIKKACNGYNDYDCIQLSDSGFARAKSFEAAQHYRPQDQNSSITINGPINATNMQVGNNNTQNIETIINNLIDEVKKSDAAPEDKNKAIELINCFFANPIISSVISGATGAGVTSFIGGM